MENKIVSFEVEDLSILEEFSEDQLAIVEVYVCHDGNNAHNLPISLETLKKCADTLKNKFLVAGFDGLDFEGHEKDERIIGFFPESTKIRYEEKDGKTFLVADAILSKVYADWAYNIFVGENDRAVSMEITVLEFADPDDEGLQEILSFVFNGVTVLGKTHLPACEGADASIIKFSSENVLGVYNRYFENQNDSQNENSLDNSREEVVSKMEEDKNVEVENTEVVETEEVVETPETEDKSFEEDKKEEDKKDEEEDSEEDDDDDDSEEDKKDIKVNETVESDDTTYMDDKCQNFESLTDMQKKEIFDAKISETLSDSWLEGYDDEYLYVRNWCEGTTYRYEYTLTGTECSLNLDSKQRVMRGGYVPFEEETEPQVETVEEVATEEPTGEEVVATEEGFEDNGEVVEETAEPVEETVTVSKEEFDSLQAKLQKYEEEEKQEAVEKVLARVVDVVPSEKMDELRNEAENYSLDEMDSYRNMVNAAAFEYITENKEDKKFSRMAIVNKNTNKKTGKYSW